MADVKISELPTASTVSDSDIVVINQGGTTKTAVRSLIKNPGTVTSVTAGTGLSGGTITGSGTVAVNYGNTAGTSCQGNDSRLSNPRTPLYHADTHGNLGADRIVITSEQISGSLTQNTSGTAANVTGTVAIINGGTGQITAQGAINALAGEVTSGNYLRGNGSNVLMSTIQAADVPTLNQNTTGTAANVTGTVAVANGGTGQTAYTDGQLLIGNTATGGLSKATLTAGSNVTITNGNGTITIATPAVGSYYEYFEHFLSSTSPFLGNMSTSNSGGTVASSGAFTSKMGVLNFSTGATASADQRAAINNAPTALSISGSNTDYYLALSLAQNSASWLSGTSTGFCRFGLLSVVAQTGIGEPTSGIYFRATNSQALEFVTRNGGVETSTSTGVSLANGTFNKYEILINATATQVIAKIDGATVATHTTNIPISTNRVGVIVTLQRVTADTNSYAMALDWLYFKATPSAPWI